jgi:hypothetical protein
MTTAQFAFPANERPHVLLEIRKSALSVPAIEMLASVIDADPRFVTVTDFAALVVPLEAVPKAKVLADS